MELKNKIIKRTFDIVFSLIALILFFPVILISWFIASIETRSNGFFLQKRIGKHAKEFSVIKIKTMFHNTNNDHITTITDKRITKSGVVFRKFKIDELPQFINILIGDMSVVGPRPDVQGYADMLVGEERAILEFRPGLTGPASIKYKNEEILLSEQEDSKRFNDEVIWPDKVKLNLNYVQNWSFFADLKYIIKTL